MAKEQTPPEVVARMGAQMVSSIVRMSANGSDKVWTLAFEIDSLDVVKVLPLIGETAYAVAFGGVYFGDGATVKASATRRDAENNSHSKVELVIPEVGTAGSQIDIYASKAPSMVGESGNLEFVEMQMRFDLTKKADDGLLPLDEDGVE